VRLRDEPGNRHLRLTYDDGVLEIMSPEFRHEKNAERVGMIVRAVASVFGLGCIGARCTTIRRGQAGTHRGKGREPDNSFYFAHAPAVRGKETIDLAVDPPPDVWVEVDNRGSSRGRLPLYAALGVPEVWRLRARRGTLWFGRLDAGAYVPIRQSLSLPMVTPELVLVLLDRADQSPDETAWDDWMRDWLEQTCRPAYDAGAGLVLP
jgi:Uma2 family endonuclease